MGSHFELVKVKSYKSSHSSITGSEICIVWPSEPLFSEMFLKVRKDFNWTNYELISVPDGAGGLTCHPSVARFALLELITQAIRRKPRKILLVRPLGDDLDLNSLRNKIRESCAIVDDILREQMHEAEVGILLADSRGLWSYL